MSHRGDTIPQDAWRLIEAYVGNKDAEALRCTSVQHRDRPRRCWVDNVDALFTSITLTAGSRTIYSDMDFRADCAMRVLARSLRDAELRHARCVQSRAWYVREGKPIPCFLRSPIEQVD